MAEKGAEPIRSLGHDAPLAALNPERKNIADFIKESVAVVTNPAIDRDRETEHFSTRIIVGKRPGLFHHEAGGEILELQTPLLIEGKIGENVSTELGQPSYDQLIQFFQKKVKTLFQSPSNLRKALKTALSRLSTEAVTAVKEGKTILILDDSITHHEGHYWLDPHLVTSAIDQSTCQTESLRRDCSLVLRSASIRSLHDIITVFGLGADLISPYYMFMTVMEDKEKPITQSIFCPCERSGKSNLDHWNS